MVWLNEKMANVKIQFSRVKTALKNDHGHKFRLLSQKTGFSQGFRARTQHKDPQIVNYKIFIIFNLESELSRYV